MINIKPNYSAMNKRKVNKIIKILNPKKIKNIIERDFKVEVLKKLE